MHSESIQVEVLLAVYNGQQYIRKQMESILLQSHKNLRIIVGDNKSEDNTLQIIQNIMRRYPDRITLITPGKNLGVVGNFAYLLHHCKSPYVLFSDCNDLWHSDKVKKTLAHMLQIEKSSRNKIPVLIHTDLKVVDQSLKVICESFWKYAHLDIPEGHRLNRMLMHNVIAGNTMMINRPLLDLATPMPKHIIMHDWWFGLVASAFGRISAIKEQTILLRLHAANDIGTKNKRNDCMSYEQAALFLRRYAPMLTEAQKALLQDFISLQKASFLKRFFLIWKNKFCKRTGKEILSALFP